MSIRDSIKAIAARADRVEAFFAVDVVRAQNGDAIPTITIDFLNADPSREQRERFHELLSAMARLLREEYTGAAK